MAPEVVSAHIRDDGVPVVGGHKFLDLARGGGLEVAAADEVGGQVVLGGCGARGAIGMSIGTRFFCSGHCVCQEPHAGRRLCEGKAAGGGRVGFTACTLGVLQLWQAQ